ncbi:MAG: diguanylate cyclase [Anaerolineae bacterium]|jgi:diguanylate cyclase (GGDEF)-like protein|nr:diguanylate cyclase [Anaerolineae bacterium]MBL8104542.1 diguanylate cyclase [Anaerolineales bacterium]MCC7187914.1 diguanylate cyclase [Anaerolineales bacterium]HQU35027.1 diguanylate cyclase [Anaerolineales bacterium]
MAILLIVDKNPTDRRAYTTLLGNYGHRFLEAEDGVQALEVARAELPDLIITDILMPTMDGFTLVRRLRAEPLLMGIPVVFQTSNYDETEIHKLARASGVTHILRKPAEPQAILRAVNDALKNPTIPSRLPQTGQLQREHLQLLADKLYEKVSALEDANERLRNLSLIDGLTGLNNRRGFMILATNLLKFARRAGYASSLIYIDLDSLKAINDMFGHAGGDAALVNFARILTSTFHDSDVSGRLGGDEFVVLIVDATHNDLVNIQALLQKNIDAYNRQIEPERALSFSMGSIRVESDSTISMEEFLTQADEAMYKHKQSRKRAGNKT